MTTLPALTVWQPWATLIMAGIKPYEFRRWAAPRAHRGRRIAIHAGARRVSPIEIRTLRMQVHSDRAGTALVREPAIALLTLALDMPEILPRASVLGTARLGDPVRAIELFGETVNDSARIDEAVWAWPLTEIEPLEPIVPCRGAQGFWRFPLPAAEAAP